MSTELDELLVSASFYQDPYPAYAELRRVEPVYWCEPWQAWVVTSHRACADVLLEPTRYSSAGYELAVLDALRRDHPGSGASLIAHYSTDVLSITDPPVHTRLRRLLMVAFTPRTVARLRSRVDELVGELLDAIHHEAEVDLLATFAYPLPALVIGELLGVPRDDQHAFMEWSADIVAYVGTGATDLDRLERAEASMTAFRDYLRPLVASRRKSPSDDLLGSLARPSPSADAMSDEELIATSVTLLFAGHETTANLIGNGLLALLRNPEQLERLRADPSRVESAVEELLRYDSPVQRNRRRASEDVELHGHVIRADQRVLAFLGAANRDPDVFPDPDRLDLDRKAVGHMAFGHGIHYCVGAALSRLEAPIAISAVLGHFPTLGLADATIRWRPNMAFRGLEALPVRLH